MEPAEVRRHLEETDALLTGHFRLSSGLHSGQYVQCAKVLAWPSRAGLLGSAIGARWAETSPDVVIGPAMGGVIIAHEVARYLGVPCYFTERVDGEMKLRRGFQLDADAKVVIVEDVVTTGGSAKEVLSLVEGMGARVIGVSCILHRSPEPDGGDPVNPFAPADFEPLMRLHVQAHGESDCPMCRQGQAIEKPGSRKIPNVAGGNAS